MPEEAMALGDPAEWSNEEKLIQRIREGEHELFYELIRPYERRVYSAALAILHNAADAEDAAQEPSSISGSFVRRRASAPG
jgi:hypothetical protein